MTEMFAAKDANLAKHPDSENDTADKNDPSDRGIRSNIIDADIPQRRTHQKIAKISNENRDRDLHPQRHMENIESRETVTPPFVEKIPKQKDQKSRSRDRRRATAGFEHTIIPYIQMEDRRIAQRIPFQMFLSCCRS